MLVENRMLVKDSIDRLTTNMDDVSRLFFRELFMLDRGLEQLLPGNVVFLNRKFASMMGTFRNLKHLEKMTESLRRMGERHARNYGVQGNHLLLAKRALMAALNQHFKDHFSPQLAAAWDQVFDEASALLLEGLNAVDRDQIQSVDYQDKAYDPGLLAEIGGREVIKRVHQRFYDAMFDHEWLGQFFFGKSKPNLIEKQTRFMVSAFGGPNEYDGDTPAFVHMHMFITDEQADLRERILRQAIREEGLSQAIADRWLSVDHAFRPAIVKQSVDECVLKNLGQMPVTASKPAGYRPDTVL